MPHNRDVAHYVTLLSCTSVRPLCARLFTFIANHVFSSVAQIPNSGLGRFIVEVYSFHKDGHTPGRTPVDKESST